jgi:hypothetical protein
VLSASVTLWLEVYVPAAGLKVGAAVTGAVTTYVAVTVPLCDAPLASAIASIVVVPVPGTIGLVYTRDEVVGAVRSVV